MTFWKERCKLKAQALGRSAVLSLEEDNGPVASETQQTLISTRITIQPGQQTVIEKEK